MRLSRSAPGSQIKCRAPHPRASGHWGRGWVGLSLRAQSRSSPHEGGPHSLTGVRGALPRFPRNPGQSPGPDRWSSAAARGRRAGLEQGALPLCCLERRALTGPWSESQSPQDVPGGTEGLHRAWGWAEGCLEVTWIGPSSGGIVLEKLGLSSGLGSLCLAAML